MRKIITALFIIKSLLFAAELDNNFIFDEKKMDEGHLYTYEYSDKNGNEKSYEYVYIKDKNSIENLRDYYHSGRELWLVSYDIDREFLMKKNEYFRTLLTDSSKYTPEAVVNYDYDNRSIKYKITTINKGKKTIKESVSKLDNETLYPYFIAGRAISDVTTTFRFLNLNKKSVDISIMDVWEKPTTYTVELEREESINGIECNKYSLKTSGLFSSLFDKSGAIWIKKDDEKQIVVKYTLNQRVTQTLKNEMAVLKDIKPMSYNQWREFIESTKEQLEQGIDF